MRVVLITSMLGLLLVAGHSQTTLQPSVVITQIKSSGQAFPKFSPFSPSVQSRSDEFADLCEDCIALSLDQLVLRNLHQAKPKQLELSLPGSSGKVLDLELYQVNLANGDPIIETSDGKIISNNSNSGYHYRGIIKGIPQSLVAVSIYEGQIMALLSSPLLGNKVLTQLDHKPGEYLLYAAEDLSERHNFDCATADSYQPYRPEELNPQAGLRSADACIKVYLEIDNDIYVDKGGETGTVEYILGIFNEVALLYANENVKLELSKIFIWTGKSPYSADNSYDMLRQFQTYRTDIDGDIGQLISYQASGGIAVVDGLCQSRTEYKLSFSSIGRSFRNVPNYSYTVMVVAHELGHLLGSQHTHACVWNGNATALDGCAGFVEGSCAIPGLPTDGGTLMSYCHISSVGINFFKGLGTQPGNLIRNLVANATCLQVCNSPDNGGGGNDPNPDQCTDVRLSITLDLFGSETSWEIRNDQGSLLGSGAGYDNKKEGSKIEQDFCLPEGCYSLKVRDSDGDGLCCSYGQGKFEVSTLDGTLLTSGSQFGFEISKNFCVSATGTDPDDGNDGGGNDGGGGDPDPGDACPMITFAPGDLLPFAGPQDQGIATLSSDGKTVVLRQNAWKYLPYNYQVTPTTILRLEFRSEIKPEVAAIGLEEDGSMSSNRMFNLYGSQSWGIRNYRNYPGNGEWKIYEIPIGTFYTGNMKSLVLAADHDRSLKNGDAQFRNIQVYESSSPCSNLAQTVNLFPTIEIDDEVTVFPNPANARIFFDIEAQSGPDSRLEIYNMYGQKVRSKMIDNGGLISVDTEELSNGTYLYKLSGFESEYTGKFNVHR